MVAIVWKGVECGRWLLWCGVAAAVLGIVLSATPMVRIWAIAALVTSYMDSCVEFEIGMLLFMTNQQCFMKGIYIAFDEMLPLCVPL